MYLAQAVCITNFKGQTLSMKNTICNTVLYNVLGFCVCKYECKSIPSLEELQSLFQAALCVRGMEGNQPGDRHRGCNALPWSEVGKSCFTTKTSALERSCESPVVHREQSEFACVHGYCYKASSAHTTLPVSCAWVEAMQSNMTRGLICNLWAGWSLLQWKGS